MSYDYDDHRDARREERRMRREEWREQWRARKDEWRERRREHRDRWRAMWGHPAAWGVNATGARPGETREELRKTVEEMKQIVATLSQRVQVLEKLAVNPEARLADEIEKLRNKPSAPPKSDT
jgi:hypothetical protein